MNKKFTPFALLLASCLGAMCEIIPSDRVSTNWASAGVRGGIPRRTTIYTTLSPGVSLATLNANIANAPSNSVVLLNSGVYNLPGTIQLRNGVTLRGSGVSMLTGGRYSASSGTVINGATVAINDPNYSYPYKSPTTVNWTAGYSKGANILTLSSVSGLAVNQILVLYQNDSGIVSNYCGGFCTIAYSEDDPEPVDNTALGQSVRVEAINGNQVTVSPGLYAPYWSGSLSPKAAWWPSSQTLRMASVEDVVVNAQGGLALDVDCALDCWATNCVFTGGNPVVMRIWGTKNFEMRRSVVSSNSVFSSSNYGMDLRWSSDWRIEDCIITVVPNDKWENVQGAVFAYNFGTNFPYSTPTTWLGETMMHHGGFPCFNLWEGNCFPSITFDDIKGSGGYATLLRNRMVGWESGKTGGTYCIGLFNHEWYINLVGNLLGTGHSSSYRGGSTDSIYWWQADSETNTYTIHGNYDTVNNAITWGTNVDRVIPESFFRTSKPEYFRSLDWPPYNPTNTTQADLSATNIPAGYRYVFGVDPALGSGTAPAITTQPVSLVNTNGSTNTFTVAAVGTAPLHYAWSFWGTNSRGGDAATLTIYGATTASNGQYRVIVTNAFGSATSTVATLTVGTPPTLTLEPTNTSVVLTSNAFFYGAASGSANLIYQWQHAGTNLPNGTTATLTLPSVATTAAGTYRVTVTNLFGSRTSSNATLTVRQPPIITLQPTNLTIPFGNNAQLVTAATGDSPLAYQWKLYGTNLAGQTSATILFTAASSNNAGPYTARVTNTYGMTTSAVAIVTVVVTPSITLQPTNTSVVLSNNLTLIGAAAGTETLYYRWQHASTNLPGQTSPSFSKAQAQTNDSGLYRLIVTNSYGAATSSMVNVTLRTPPIIRTNPVASIVLAVGSTTNLSVSATGDSTLVYQWRFFGTNLPGQTATTLTLGSIDTADAGQYRVVVTNLYGAVTSSACALTVTTSGEPPLCAPGVRISPTNAVTVGESVLFTASVTGDPALLYQWYKGSTLLSNATNTTYSIASVATNDSGVYTVAVTNNFGGIECSATLSATNVLTPPTILVQPQSFTVLVGTSTNISISATNTTGYQWVRNGYSLENATNSSVVFSSIQKTNEGSYYCIVTNGDGFILSQSVVLTVGVPASIVNFTVEPADTVEVGTQVHMEIIGMTGDTPITIRWLRNSVVIPGLNGLSRDFAATIADNGEYVVTVTNAYGGASDILPLTVIQSPVFTLHPVSRAGLVGSSQTFTASVTADPSADIIWLKEGSADVIGNGNSLTLVGITPDSAGNYFAKALTGDSQIDSVMAQLQVLDPDTIFDFRCCGK